MTTDELIKRLQYLQEQTGEEEIRVVSDDYCIGINNITDVRHNTDRDRIEIVCNQIEKKL